MIDKPDFEPEFYEKQILQMKSRYESLFKKWKYSWKKYFTEIENGCRNKNYWIWCCLVGLEKTIRDCEGQRPSLAFLEKDRSIRIQKVIGDFYKNETYVRDL